MLEEGNSKAWFESPLIVTLGVIAATVLPLFAWWQLSDRNEVPVVSLKVLKNRDLSAGLVLFVVLGFGLYGGVFIYPMFAQNVMHMTPTETGLTLLPGGIMTGFAAISSGRLLSGPKPAFEPKIAIIAGLGVYLTSISMLAALPSTAGSANVVVPLLLRGLGLGMLFVPINLAAFSSLEGAQIAQGSGLLNLARQLGGSFGIATIGSFVTHHIASARVGLVENITAVNPLLTQRIDQLQAYFMTRGMGPEQAHRAAFAVIDRGLMTEAATKAYNASFQMILFVSLIASPSIFLLRGRKSRAAASRSALADAH
jgi:DHA2 family multidrug resistance protein